MKIVSATPADCEEIHGLICLKAEFDRAMGGFDGCASNTVDNIRETLFARVPFAYAILARQDDEAIGMALYHFRYSSFSGRPSLWLDDLYVVDGHRSRGVGRQLMWAVAQEAGQKSCSHVAWTASPNNLRGHRFYERIGAVIERQEGGRPYYRWSVSAAAG